MRVCPVLRTVRLMVAGVLREGWRAGAPITGLTLRRPTDPDRFYVSLQITLLSTFIFTYIASILILMEFEK